tara:strand:+ start:10463 stop:11971 length:1509 start_codon:yes stop_codon:yes gene_type:complete
MSSESISLPQLHIKIDELYNKYSDNSNILSKLNQYILIDMPNLLDNIQKNLISKENRRLSLQNAFDKFSNNFIQSNQFFYCITSEIFFIYDFETFTTIKEDDLIHKILTAIRTNSELLPWKFKIKTSIVKQIKDKAILSAIPESITIHNVIELFSKVFDTKTAVKHFLTTIGDIILKKQININLISPNAKNFIRDIENSGSQYFGHIPLLSAFKFKYHDHPYDTCRIIVTNTKIDSSLHDSLLKIMIDVIIVACYYSNRYNNADAYLLMSGDITLSERVLFLKQNSQTVIINKFIDNKIQSSSNTNITMKNMLYLWKLYLDEIKVPHIIFINTFKTIIKTQLKYDEENESFIDYTSNQLPIVSNFLTFWDENIYENQNEYYLEVEEIYTLFKLSQNKSIDINENIILNLIRHFYPDIIIDGRYLYGISCKSWNKQDDILKFLTEFIKKDINTAISIYELYSEYTNYCKHNKLPIIINKPYFDMFIPIINDKLFPTLTLIQNI